MLQRQRSFIFKFAKTCFIVYEKAVRRDRARRIKNIIRKELMNSDLFYEQRNRNQKSFFKNTTGGICFELEKRNYFFPDCLK